MFNNPHFDRLRKLFADQFEGEAPNITYRKNSKAAPVRVSAEERADFIAAFDRTIRYGLWGLVAGTVALSIVIVAIALSSNSEVSNLSIYAGIGVIMVVFFALIARAWHAPARALQDRLTTGSARSSIEMRRLFFARTSYGQIALAGGIGVFLPLIMANRYDVLHGWGRLWIVVGAALVILAPVQAFRKWRFETAAKRP